MKNYNVDYSTTEPKELQLISTKGEYNTWRVYFDVVEDLEKKEEWTNTVIEYHEEWNEEMGVMIQVPQEVEKTFVTHFYSSKFIEKKLHNSIEPTALDIVKSQVIDEITEYDLKSDVNSFKLGGQEVWLDKDTRVGLMNSTAIQKSNGELNTTLWLGILSITLPCDQVIQVLKSLEMYALECYNRTAEHKKAVNEFTTVKEVVDYDYTLGYPEKLDIPYALG